MLRLPVEIPPFDYSLAGRRLPASFLIPPPRNRRPRLVSTGGATSLQKSFSGSSFYLAKSGAELGLIDGAFTLYDGTGFGMVQVKGALWKMLRVVRQQPAGAFKFTSLFNDTLWRKFLPNFPGCDIIHNTQLVGDHFIRNRRKHGIRSIFYIDGTLREYITDYRDYDLKNDDHSIFARAILVEQRGYVDAEKIVAMSKSTAETLVRCYGISRAKIEVVPPGANIDENLPVETPRIKSDDEFVVGAIGYYPERKGFARLIDAVRLLRHSGQKICIHIIGNLPSGYVAGAGLIHHGIVDKSKEMDRYFALVRRFDLGCQLSYAEFVGIALLEYLRLGIPIMGTTVGGATDVLARGGSISVPRDISRETLASELLSLMGNSARYQSLRIEAAALREWASWKRAAQSLDQIISAAEG